MTTAMYQMSSMLDMESYEGESKSISKRRAVRIKKEMEKVAWLLDDPRLPPLSLETQGHIGYAMIKACLDKVELKTAKVGNRFVSIDWKGVMTIGEEPRVEFDYDANDVSD